MPYPSPLAKSGKLCLQTPNKNQKQMKNYERTHLKGSCQPPSLPFGHQMSWIFISITNEYFHRTFQQIKFRFCKLTLYSQVAFPYIFHRIFLRQSSGETKENRLICRINKSQSVLGGGGLRGGGLGRVATLIFLGILG